MYDFRHSICKSILFILLIGSFASIKAQTSKIDSADILKRMAFQDSIFNQLKNNKLSPKAKAKETVPVTKSVPSNSTTVVKPSPINDPIYKSDTVTTPKRKFFPSKNEALIDTIKTDTTVGLTTLTSKKIKKQKKIDTTHYSPKTAAWRAAVCPGLGQIYMKKYWKLPIVYAAMGAVLYFVIDNGQKLRKFNGYIRNSYNDVPNPEPYSDYDAEELASFRDTYRKNVQLAAFGTIFVWGLSIVDAVVDAHLHSFDISDNLSIKVKPKINNLNEMYYAGIALNLNIK